MFDSLFRPRVRVMRWEGRDVTIRPPTLETLVRCFETLGTPLMLLAADREKIMEIPAELRVASVCTLLAQQPVSAGVLETVTGPLPALRESAELRSQVFQAAAELIDLAFLLDEFDFSRAQVPDDAVPVSPAKDRSFDDVLLQMGNLFGCSPAEFWTWPVDAFRYAMSSMPRLLGLGSSEDQIDGSGPRAALAAAGMPVYTVRKPEA